MTVEDDLAIRRVLAEYCLRIDRADFVGAADLFIAEGAFAFGEEVVTGRGAMAAWWEQQQPPHRRGKHIASNEVIDVDGDRAAVTSEFLFVRWIRGVLTVELAGRYVDDLVRSGGRWSIERRVVELLAPPAH